MADEAQNILAEMMALQQAAQGFYPEPEQAVVEAGTVPVPMANAGDKGKALVLLLGALSRDPSKSIAPLIKRRDEAQQFNARARQFASRDNAEFKQQYEELRQRIADRTTDLAKSSLAEETRRREKAKEKLTDAERWREQMDLQWETLRSQSREGTELSRHFDEILDEVVRINTELAGLPPNAVPPEEAMMMARRLESLVMQLPESKLSPERRRLFLETIDRFLGDNAPTEEEGPPGQLTTDTPGDGVSTIPGGLLEALKVAGDFVAGYTEFTGLSLGREVGNPLRAGEVPLDIDRGLKTDAQALIDKKRKGKTLNQRDLQKAAEIAEAAGLDRAAAVLGLTEVEARAVSDILEAKQQVAPNDGRRTRSSAPQG